jgi:hypothetical protein
MAGGICLQQLLPPSSWHCKCWVAHEGQVEELDQEATWPQQTHTSQGRTVSWPTTNFSGIPPTIFSSPSNPFASSFSGLPGLNQLLTFIFISLQVSAWCPLTQLGSFCREPGPTRGPHSLPWLLCGAWETWKDHSWGHSEQGTSSGQQRTEGGMSPLLTCQVLHEHS